MLIHVVYM